MSILPMTNFKNFLQISVEASISEETGGLTTGYIVLKKTLSLLECLLIKSERCFALAFLAVVWEVARVDLKYFMKITPLNALTLYSKKVQPVAQVE